MSNPSERGEASRDIANSHDSPSVRRELRRGTRRSREAGATYCDVSRDDGHPRIVAAASRRETRAFHHHARGIREFGNPAWSTTDSLHPVSGDDERRGQKRDGRRAADTGGSRDRGGTCAEYRRRMAPPTARELGFHDGRRASLLVRSCVGERYNSGSTVTSRSLTPANSAAAAVTRRRHVSGIPAKVTKMASQEGSDGSVESSIADKANTTSQPKANEKKSLSVERLDEPINTAADTKEKKNLMSNAADDCTIVQEIGSNNTKNTDHLKSLVIENKQDDSKIDKKTEAQNVTALADPKNTDREKEVIPRRRSGEDVLIKEFVFKRKRKSNAATSAEFPAEENKSDKKKETQNVISLADPQSTNEEKEVRSEDAPTKGSVFKRKRKSNATTAAEFPVEESKTDKKRETQNVISLADSQNTDNEKEAKNEDTPKGFVFKRKRRSTFEESKMDKKKETQNVSSHADSESSDEEKEIKTKDASTKESVLKRKRKSSSLDISIEESGTRSKRKKSKTGHDRFCWRCHKEKVDAYCTACSRSWHRKCIGGMPSSLEKWICGECATILKAENAETRSIAMAQLSIDQLCMLLKHVIERLRDYPGSDPFCKPVDLLEVPNYMDYVIKPMDLSLLELNVRAKLYGSTDAFMADAKWIQHNCVVFNTCGGVYTDTSKLTNAAKQIIKVARQEVSEIEACPDCYAHGRNLPRPQPSWFIEPCRRPHPLVWAKLKGFPFWPAKAMPRVNSQGYVDVRFFGEHDRAWVPSKDLFLYSEEPPAPSPRKRKSDMDECVREVTRHIAKLTLMFGQFKYAQPKVQYDPNNLMQIKLMLPNYNPLESNDYLSSSLESSETTSQKKVPQKKRSLLKNKQSDESADIIEINIDSKDDAREKKDEVTISKVQKLDTDIKDASNTQTNLDDSHNKLNKKADQEIIKSTPQEVAQNKMAKDDKPRNTRTSTSRLNIAPIDNAVENNSVNPSASISDKNNSLKARHEMRSFVKILPKPPIQPSIELCDTARAMQKKFLLKNIINPKLALSQVDNSKMVAKYGKNNKLFKPKAKLEQINKLNTEKELRPVTASKDKLSNSSKDIPQVSLLNNNNDSSNTQKSVPEIEEIRLKSNISSTCTIPSGNPIVPIGDKPVLLLVVNGKPAEPAQQIASIADHQGNKDVLSVEGHHNSPKKESKARKSFPGRSPNSPKVQRTSHVSNADDIIQVSPVKSQTTSSYQLLPPEAGPISARLYHDAHDLARRMGHLMEEAYKEAAQDNVNGENGTADSFQATIFFLRMQIEHLKWQHQQQIAELKHNTDRTLREMRASLEAEKLRSVEEVRREVEEDKFRCIEETKRKQWCAKCGQEAIFYCCWNTAYCNYPCQQSHWPTHMQTCSQQPPYNSVATNSGANLNPQQRNNVVTNDSTSKAHSLLSNKLSGIPSSSTTSLRNKIS